MVRNSAPGSSARRGAVLLLPAILVICSFFLFPVALLIRSAFTSDGGGFTLANVAYVAGRHAYWAAAIRTVALSAFGALLSIAVCLPAACHLALHSRFGRIWLLLLTVTFWVSLLVRILSWKIFLGPTGPLGWVFGTEFIGKLLYNDFSVGVAIAYSQLPVCLAVLFAAVSGLDRNLLEAARQLGANPWQVFRHVTMPLIRKGVAVAFGLSFLYGTASFLEAELLGPASSVMLGTLLRNHFDRVLSWHVGSALALFLLATACGIILVLLSTGSLVRHFYGDPSESRES